MIIYDPLWRTLKERKITQYRLINYYGISSGQIHRLKQNDYVSTHTIGMLCRILNCRVEDIMQFYNDDREYTLPVPSGFYDDPARQDDQ